MLRQLIDLIPHNIDYFLLALARISGLFVASNLFGRRNIPGVTRIGWAATLTLVALYAFPPLEPLSYGGVIEYGVMIALEMLLGVTMGYIMNMFFMVTAFVSGHIMDMHMGFGMVNVFDVGSSTTVSVTGNVVNILLTLMFFALDCHTKVIYMLQTTFEYIPVGGIVLSPQLGMLMVKLLMQTFVLALNIAMPFITAGLLFEFAMGVVIRTTPQMNMFVVGMPMKVMLGLVLLMAITPFHANFSQTVFTQMFYAMEEAMGGFMA